MVKDSTGRIRKASTDPVPRVDEPRSKAMYRGEFAVPTMVTSSTDNASA